METKNPGAEAIDRLVAYLPRLYADGFEPVTRWEGGTQDEEGRWRLPWPVYDPLVTEFFGVVAGDGWLDREYDPAEARRMLMSEAEVERASLPELRSMLTFCARGERFADGHRAEMIEDGHIRRLLMRLEQLRGEASNDPAVPPSGS
jgi:hypothetical protein